MAKAFASVFLLLFSLISVCHLGMGLADSQKTWCVVKPSSEQKVLSDNINFACSQVDCKILQPGGACYIPGNNFNQASVAMNLYYQANGRNQWNCNFGNSGLIVVTDPSYGSCKYA